MRMLRTLARGTESGFENISKRELRKKVRKKEGKRREWNTMLEKARGRLKRTGLLEPVHLIEVKRTFLKLLIRNATIK